MKKRKKYRGWTVRRTAEKSWAADNNAKGAKRLRKRFDTYEDAVGWIDTMIARLETEGREGLELSADNRRDAATALRTLGGRASLADAARTLAGALDMLDGRATVEEAVRFWLVHHPDAGRHGIGELVEGYLADRRARGCRGSYLSLLRQRLGRVAAALGKDTPVPMVFGTDLERFMAGVKAGTAESWNGWRSVLRGFFGWAARRCGLEGNPAAGIPKRRMAESSPSFLGAADAERLLRAAEALEGEAGWARGCAVATALLFFAGIRPAELAGAYWGDPDAPPRPGGCVAGGLRWGDVDAEGRTVRIRGEVSKVAQARLIPVEDALAAWIGTVADGEREGRVVRNPTWWRRARREIARKAGVAWGKDAARHTYATMHFAKYRDRAALEAAMGHGRDSTVLEIHYKGLATAAEAERFWGIRPTGAPRAIVDGRRS